MKVLGESMSRIRVEKLCKVIETKMVIGLSVYTFGGVGLGQGQQRRGD